MTPLWNRNERVYLVDPLATGHPIGYFAEDFGPGEDLKYGLTAEERAAGAAAANAYDMGPSSDLNRPLTEAEKAAGAAAAAAAGQVSPAPAPTGSGSMIIPLLLGVAALLIFTGTLNLGSKKGK
jgi:hypothetical protein